MTRASEARQDPLWIPWIDPRAQFAAILAVGSYLYWLSRFHPAAAPVWAPWDFSWPEYLVFVLTLVWFFRGLASAPPQARPSVARRIAFLSGLVLTYAVMQTHFDYMAQHMFFLNRMQHVVMHHLGPFLIALGLAGGTIRRGMPAQLQRAVDSGPVVIAMRILQQPVLAVVLFVGLFYFWLIPSVHFRAMIDPRLYLLMNASMVLDGLLFWSLVLDPRPRPPARISYGVRFALAAAVMFPQIAVGAVITFSQHDLYPYYDLCGRLFPSVSALDDQHIGGIVMWIPPAMMSVTAALLVLNALRIHDESTEAKRHAASSDVTSVSR